MPVVLGAASAITSRRVGLYGLLSTVAAAAVVVNAFRQRSNFYAATVMLGGSNGCMMVLLNFAFFLALCVGKVGQKIFFGELRAVEVEHLHERLWYAITESLLAMTIFRDDFDASFAILFVTLLFLKVFHWLSADRVEYMEQTPSVSRLFHVRMIAVLSVLFEFDLFLATFAVEILIVDRQRKGIMIMFASEFFILGASLWSTIAKYLINCQDMRSDEPWQAKSMYVFFVDLITDFLKLATYVACFCLILSYYGLPLNIIRDVYMTGRSFFGRLRDFVQYRAATRNMDTRFPDASSSDLRNSSDGTCIICREEMVAATDVENASGEAQGRSEPNSHPASPPASSGLNETPKKLPCGHIFHFHCLRSWLERQQSCPTCRRTVFATTQGADGAETNVLPNVGGPAGVAPVAQHAGFGAALAPPPQAQGSAPTGTQTEAQNRNNATQSAQQRLQSFMQQLQADAQRIREEHRQQTQPPPRGTRQQGQASNDRRPADGTQTTVSSGMRANPNRAAATGRATDQTHSPARRMLVNSLFAHRDVLAARRREMGRGEGSTSALPPAPLQQGSLDSQNEGRDGVQPSWIPPAPWTMRSRSREPTRPSDLASSSRKEVASEPASADALPEVPDRENTPTPKARGQANEASRTSEQDDTEGTASATLDPTDAREAARAAALRRFAAQQSAGKMKSTAPSASQTNGTAALHAKTVATDPASMTTKQVKLPGDPHLIPLFETADIEDFDSHHTPHLPFPLLQRDRARVADTVSAVGPRLALQELSSLALTDADLSELSQQTRKGLEERLRLLYRVEGAVAHLVEELTRALSVLPEGDIVRSNDDHAPLRGAEAVDDSNHGSDTQGKGKAPAEGLHASPFHDASL